MLGIILGVIFLGASWALHNKAFGLEECFQAITAQQHALGQKTRFQMRTLSLFSGALGANGVYLIVVVFADKACGT